MDSWVSVINLQIFDLIGYCTNLKNIYLVFNMHLSVRLISYQKYLDRHRIVNCRPKFKAVRQ